MRWSRHLQTAASAIVPGLGQLFAGRFADAVLFAFVMLWVRLALAGWAGHADGDRLGGFLFGAPAIERGFATPLVVFFSVLLVLLHAFAAWAAWHTARRPG